jgi:N-acyl-D-aspartate/D-glutamate deacylase
MTGLVIKGGTVIDGTGAPRVRADVAIDGGRVVAIGPDLTGDWVLDADGHVVAPGFVDIHTHYDAQVFWDPQLTPSCFHGVTTVVAGNCGFSIAPTRPEHVDLLARTLENVEDMNAEALRVGVPWDRFSTFPEYLRAVQRNGLALNYTAYLGHTALRLFTMGDEAYERAATAEEITMMQAVLREAMDAGAAGFATSFGVAHRGADGRPVPSRLAERAEVDALLHTLAETGRGVAAFSPGELLAAEDLYELQSAVGRPFTFTALLSLPTGRHRRLLEVNRLGWERGAEVWPQVSSRPLKFTFPMADPFTLNPNPAFAELMTADVETRRLAYGDPTFRARALAGWRNGPLPPRWDTYEISEYATNPELNDRRLADVAAERGQTPFDTLLDLAVDEPTMRVGCLVANDDPDEVAKILGAEHCALGASDAGAHVGMLCDAGQATDYLGSWVRDRGVLPLEEGIRRLTSQQTDIFGIEGRGRLVPGSYADVVVFDPDTIAPGPIRRVRDFPANSERVTADAPIGIRHVLVNGVPIQVDGVHDAETRPGQLVRPA